MVDAKEMQEFAIKLLQQCAGSRFDLGLAALLWAAERWSIIGIEGKITTRPFTPEEIVGIVKTWENIISLSYKNIVAAAEMQLAISNKNEPIN